MSRTRSNFARKPGHRVAARVVTGRMSRLLVPGLAFMAVFAPAQGALAQSLLVGDPEPRRPELSAPALGAEPTAHVAEQLQSVSLFAVVPPKPRTFAKHDLVEIIINESSVQKLEQKLETDKQYNLAAELSRFPSLRHLLEAQLREGDSTGLPVGVGGKANSKFKGDGEFERKDSLTARLTAKVLDVKPNGTLVLEAREHTSRNDESATMVLSGICRSEDITRQNTIQSSQLAELNIRIEQEGEINDAGKKGLIPRVLDAIFNF